MKPEIEAIQVQYGVSSPAILRRIEKNIRKGNSDSDFDWEHIIPLLPKMSDRLAQLGLDQDWVDYALESFSELKEDIPGFKDMTFEKLFRLLQDESLQKLSPVSVQLLISTFLNDDEVMYFDYFKPKFINTLNTYSQFSPDQQLSGQNKEGLYRFSEKDSIDISARLLMAFMEAGLQMAYDNYSGEVTVKNGKKETSIGTEFFMDHKCMVMVRCGYLFFVDSKYRSLVPEDVQRMASQNIIYIDNMKNSEFNCRLGYFTCNTIASLMQMDLKGKTVMDCGCGTANLSLAIQKLGAERVIGFDIDQKQLAKAVPNIEANGCSGSISVHNVDLRDTDKVVSIILGNMEGSDLVIVSNLGYWREYPIYNINNIKYAELLSSFGINVTDVVTGGLDPSVGAKFHDHEEEFVTRTCGLSLPTRDIDLDQKMLRSLGYKIKTVSSSHVLQDVGAFPRQAGSVLASK